MPTLSDLRTYKGEVSMTNQTEATELDKLMEEGDDDSALVKELRSKLRKEAAARKEAQSEVESFRETRKQSRVKAVTDAVNGKGIPQAAVDALVAQVEDYADDEFVTVLEQLGGVASATAESEEGEQSPQATPPAVNPADLGEQVAAAASGGGAEDPLALLRKAKNRAELEAAASQLGLDQL